MFLIKSLALNTFTGIATNEIRSLIEKCHIQIMKEKIDYIYDVLVFKYFDRFEGFWRCKRGFIMLRSRVAFDVKIIYHATEWLWASLNELK